jgi:preprotein translocase subunit SecD
VTGGSREVKIHHRRDFFIVSEGVVLKSARPLVVALAVMSAVAPSAGTAVARAACPQVGFTIVEPHASSLTRAVKFGGNQTIFVRRVPTTTTGDIVDIRLAANDDDATLLIKFSSAADQRLHEATTNHSGLRIAFMFNDEVLVNAVWEGPYGMDLGGSQVSIRHGMAQAQRLMKAIRGCTGAIAG